MALTLTKSKQIFVKTLTEKAITLEVEIEYIMLRPRFKIRRVSNLINKG